MRRLLVERARRAGREKRGGGRARVDLDDAGAEADPSAEIDLLSLDEAMTRLEAFDPDLARVVALRYFAGLGVDETASVLGVSPRTVKREWSVARAWLHRAMTGEGDAAEGDRGSA
jgi:RNA polymerase sigma factor (TIGR02999 family)